MKRSRFSEAQIVYAIRQAESGTPVVGFCRQLGVSEATFYTRMSSSTLFGQANPWKMPSLNRFMGASVTSI